MKKLLCFLFIFSILPVYAGLFDEFDMSEADVIRYVQKVGYNHAFDDIMNNSSLNKPILKIGSINRRYDIVMNYLINNYPQDKSFRAQEQMDMAVQNAINSLSTNKTVSTVPSTSINSNITSYPPPPPPPFIFDYGYNAIGNYAPSAVGGQQIQYGYNAVGDFVPMSVGGRQINYGYNAEGDYVPMSF